MDGAYPDGHMGWSDLVPFLHKKNKRPHPGTQILSQIPEGGEGNRGQMPHICPGFPVGLNIDRCIICVMHPGESITLDNNQYYWLISINLICDSSLIFVENDNIQDKLPF